MSDKQNTQEKECHYVYFLRCSDGTLYCGYTNNLEKRISAHNEGKGAKYTKTRLPVSLVYYEEFDNKVEAMSREWHIHHDSVYTKKKKEEMVRDFQKRNSAIKESGLIKKRITCGNCEYFDYCDSKIQEENKKHPYKASWNHLCIVKNILKFSCNKACKKHFKEKMERNS